MPFLLKLERSTTIIFMRASMIFECGMAAGEAVEISKEEVEANAELQKEISNRNPNHSN